MDNQWKYAGVAGASILLTLAAASWAGETPGMGRLGRADTNGDGVVSHAEWMAAAEARFARLDANRDGKLDASELPRRGHGRHGGRRDGPDGDRMHSGYDSGRPADLTLPGAAAPR